MVLLYREVEMEEHCCLGANDWLGSPRAPSSDRHEALRQWVRSITAHKSPYPLFLLDRGWLVRPWSNLLKKLISDWMICSFILVYQAVARHLPLSEFEQVIWSNIHDSGKRFLKVVRAGRQATVGLRV